MFAIVLAVLDWLSFVFEKHSFHALIGRRFRNVADSLIDTAPNYRGIKMVLRMKIGAEIQNSGLGFFDWKRD